MIDTVQAPPQNRGALHTPYRAEIVPGIVARWASSGSGRATGQLPLLDRKRLELAKTIASRAKLLLLDEIAAGLTEREVEQLVALIGALKARQRRPVLGPAAGPPRVRARGRRDRALFLFRLREAYFAIGMWVFSEIVSLVISKSEWLGVRRHPPSRTQDIAPLESPVSARA